MELTANLELCAVCFQGEVQVGPDVSGHLCIKKPWPGQARTIWGDHEKFLDIYYRPHPGRETREGGRLGVYSFILGPFPLQIFIRKGRGRGVRLD